MQSDKVKKFIEQVCAQVKAERVHSLLSYELAAHIEDQREAYIKSGISAEEAEELAVEQMGDPVQVGEELNQIHKKKFDWLPELIMWLIAGVIALASVAGGVILAAVTYGTEEALVGMTGIALAALGVIISLIFISVWKFTAYRIYAYMLIKDYRRKKNKTGKQE
ncbi:MAG: permease prefix domain 1-containing protein [Oscillospiraceae bacterium]|nr:permease prefix domain 1-containing protein [Oscillospiraceae bacterium]